VINLIFDQQRTKTPPSRHLFPCKLRSLVPHAPAVCVLRWADRLMLVCHNNALGRN
jgi:hypothetical protein